MIQIIATVIAVLLMGAPIAPDPVNDEWVIISFPDGAEVQGACNWWRNCDNNQIEVCVDGEIYLLDAELVDFN